MRKTVRLADCGRVRPLSERFVTVAGGLAARAVESADGADVNPRHVAVGKGARDRRALTGGLGEEAHAGARNLRRANLVRRLHTLAVGDAGVVERAQTLHVNRAPGVHERAQNQAEALDGRPGVRAADSGDEGYLLAQLRHLDRLAHGDRLGVPPLGHHLVDCFEECHDVNVFMCYTMSPQGDFYCVLNCG